jgi:type I restriction enzyme R subunit
LQGLEIITEENLNEEAKRYITSSLKRDNASEKGTQLNALLPQMSPLNPLYLTKKQIVLQRITEKAETSTHNNKRGITERP